jgi:hypothetical protein
MKEKFRFDNKLVELILAANTGKAATDLYKKIQHALAVRENEVYQNGFQDGTNQLKSQLCGLIGAKEDF